MIRRLQFVSLDSRVQPNRFLFIVNLLSSVLSLEETEKMWAVPSHCNVWTGLSLRVQKQKTLSSICPSYRWWGSVYVPCLVLDPNPALREPTVTRGDRPVIRFQCSSGTKSVCRNGTDTSSSLSHWVLTGRRFMLSQSSKNCSAVKYTYYQTIVGLVESVSKSVNWLGSWLMKDIKMLLLWF